MASYTRLGATDLSNRPVSSGRIAAMRSLASSHPPILMTTDRTVALDLAVLPLVIIHGEG